jgi:hypothetical protein
MTNPNESSRPKTIADLGNHQAPPQPVVGKSMITESNERDALLARIKKLEEERKRENDMLEAGGYDYDGREAFAQVMQRVGRM